MKYHILVFWCQMNYADSARISTVLKNLWRNESSLKDADIVIFDTCSVRQKSEDKITWKLKEIPKDKKIWITWCMVQHNMKLNRILENKKISQRWTSKFKTWNFIWDIKQITINDVKFLINNVFQPLYTTLKKKFPNIELMFRIDDLYFLPLFLKYLWYNIDNIDIKNFSTYIDLIPETSNYTLNENIKTAYIPISTWCNQFCSYCIVPFARWFERYRTVDNILNEIKYWLDRWKEEIVLLWQIVNKHPEFTKILKEIIKLKKVKWLRYTSPYPTYYNDEIFLLHENEEKLCPHIHIPVQSWSDKILKLMNRWYTIKEFKTFIDKIHNLKRNISITTDIIVWFSNETDLDFQETLNIVKYWKFDMIYTWIYSPRPWTFAYKNLNDNITKKIKQERRKIINDLLYKISEHNNKQEIWKIRKTMIIWKKINKWQTIFYWYTDNFKNIEIDNFDIKKIWQIVKIKIKDWIALKLFWEIS